jgi:hypothetical protein
MERLRCDDKVKKKKQHENQTADEQTGQVNKRTK